MCITIEFLLPFQAVTLSSVLLLEQAIRVELILFGQEESLAKETCTFKACQLRSNVTVTSIYSTRTILRVFGKSSTHRTFVIVVSKNVIRIIKSEGSWSFPRIVP